MTLNIDAFFAVVGKEVPAADVEGLPRPNSSQSGTLTDVVCREVSGLL